MEPENEKQFGRRRSFRKPMKQKSTDDDQTSNNKENAGESKSPEEILSILEKEQADKPKEIPERSQQRPKTERKPGGHSRRPQRPRGERPRKSEKATGKGPRRDTDTRASRPRRSSDVKLSMIIPAYNEEGNVEALMAQFNELFKNLPYKAEMIFIDDGSTDRTLARAKDAQMRHNWLRIYTHRINRGLTEALQTGFDNATGKILCFYPSDLQFHANDIPKMVSKIDSGADVVTGWKQGKYGIKSLGSFIYNLLSRLLFKVNVHDLNSVKAFRKEVTDCFTYRRGWHRYMVVMAAQAGFKVDEVKVRLFSRKSGKSKFGLTQLPAGFLDLLSVKFELSFTKKPLLFFGSAGILCGFLGFLVGLVSLYLRFVEHAGFRPLLYAVILLMTSGLMLFAIGFLAELIVSIKEEISRKKIAR